MRLHRQADLEAGRWQPLEFDAPKAPQTAEDLPGGPLRARLARAIGPRVLKPHGRGRVRYCEVRRVDAARKTTARLELFGFGHGRWQPGVNQRQGL